MPIDIKQYAAQLAKDAGLPDEQAKAFLEVVGNEKVGKALSDGFLRQEDYSRNMDGLKAEQGKMSNWYAEQLKVAERNEKIVTEATGRAAKYQELYGDLDGTSPKGPVDTSQFIDKKTFDERMNQLGTQAISITKSGMRCSADYMKRFNEVLDPDALEAFAIKSGLPLDAAYEKFIEPRVKEIDGKSTEEKLKAAREEGMREGLSKRDNPTNPGNPEPNGFIHNLRAAQKGAPTTARAGFVDTWNKAAQ